MFVIGLINNLGTEFDRYDRVKNYVQRGQMQSRSFIYLLHKWFNEWTGKT